MAILFSSTNYLTTTGTYTNYSNCSIAVWCKFTALNTALSSANFLANRICGTDDLWEVRACTDWSGSNSVFQFAAEFFCSGSTVPCVSNTTVAINTQYHVVFTISGGNQAQVFVNGLLENSLTISPTEAPSATTFWIGNRSGAPAGQCFNGVMDDLRVYNRVLSANEVETIYNAKGSDHIHYGLVNKWLLNEGAVGATVSGTGAVKDITNTFNATPSDTTLTYASSFLKWRRQPWQT